MRNHFKLIIIGAGPSGLSAAISASQHDISYLLLEASTAVASTVRSYQRGKLVMAEPRGLPIRSPLPFAAALREVVLENWEKSVKEHDLNIRYESKVIGIGKEKFSVPHGNEQNVWNALKLGDKKDFDRHSETLKTAGCAYCHEVIEAETQSAFTWRVKPLLINQDWFSKARFKHESHRTQKCLSCHKVEQSQSSEDVAMPDKKVCLSCHSGNTPKHKRIASGCTPCHDFHNAHHTFGELLNRSPLNQKELNTLVNTLNQDSQ